MKDLIVNEIFYSIDGEGRRAGCPSIFIRLAGCNLRCNYCDTGYALKLGSGVRLTIPEILFSIKKYPCKNVTLTGGEPLLQSRAKDLVLALWKEGYSTVIETNGAVRIFDVAQYAYICMDWKMPSSGMCDAMLEENLKILWRDDALKVVVRKEDLDYLDDFLKKNTLECPVYISAVFGEIDLKDIVEFVKNYQGDNEIRMQLQMHKIIWNPDERGV